MTGVSGTDLTSTGLGNGVADRDDLERAGATASTGLLRVDKSPVVAGAAAAPLGFAVDPTDDAGAPFAPFWASPAVSLDGCGGASRLEMLGSEVPAPVAGLGNSVILAGSGAVGGSGARAEAG